MTNTEPSGTAGETDDQDWEEGMSEALEMVGRHVRRWRERAGLTQAELGNAIGYTEHQVSAVERGRRIPKPAFLDKADEVLGAEGMLAEFKEHVKSTGLKIDEALWQQDLSFIRAMVRFEIDSDLFGIAVASENLAKSDPQLQFGVSLFPEAEQLLNLGRRNQTSRVALR